MRTFIALSLAESSQDALGDMSARMAYQDKSNAVRWVDQQNYHLTLAFVGELDQRDTELLIHNLESDLQSYGVSGEVSGLSPFPTARPKLIAAMVSANEGLLDVHQQVVSCLTSSSIAFDKRRFAPHITLGRLRHSRNAYGGLIPISQQLDIEFDGIVVYESILSHQGAQYEPLFTYPLSDNSEYFANDYHFSNDYEA